MCAPSSAASNSIMEIGRCSSTLDKGQLRSQQFYLLIAEELPAHRLANKLPLLLDGAWTDLLEGNTWVHYTHLLVPGQPRVCAGVEEYPEYRWVPRNVGSDDVCAHVQVVSCAQVCVQSQRARVQRQRVWHDVPAHTDNNHFQRFTNTFFYLWLNYKFKTNLNSYFTQQFHIAFQELFNNW